MASMIIPILALAMFISPSPPSVPAEDINLASTFYKDCKVFIKLSGTTTASDNGTTDDYARASTCVGYIDGLADGMDLKANSICLGSSGVTTGTMAHVYVLFMDKNPKLLTGPRGHSLFLALQDAYPCAAK